MISAKRKTSHCFATRQVVTQWLLNGRPLQTYDAPALHELVNRYPEVPPLALRVHGGGKQGQIRAVTLAIAKHIAAISSSHRDGLLAYSKTILTTDSKKKLPKMPGCKGHRSTRQKSYR